MDKTMDIGKIKNPRVSVIVLTWNQCDITRRCVKSVLDGQDYKDFELVLVDNSSGDDTVEVMKKEFGSNPHFRLVESWDNLGYAGGNNLGMREAQATNYICVLNNDVVVGKHWLSSMVKMLDEHSEASAICLGTEHRHTDDGMKEIDYSSIRMNYLQFGVKDSDKKSLECNFVTGCSFLMRKGWRFNELYFIYSEEQELCLRMITQGWKVLVCPESVIEHLHNWTRKHNTDFRKHASFLGERNRLLNVLCFFQLRTMVLLSPLILLSMLGSIVKNWRYVLHKIRAWLWLLVHLNYILDQRRKVREARKVSDKELGFVWRLWGK